MQPTREEAIKKLHDLIKGIKTASLVTVDNNGQLHSRPMVTQEAEFNGDVWFFTARDTDKTYESEMHPQVNVTYASGNTFVSLAGRASIVDDVAKKKELWKESLRVWFENGPEDPNVVLLKVEGDEAQYWDAPDGPIGSLVAMAKVVLTGNKNAAGESAKVNL
jgi:general stress protein 26